MADKKKILLQTQQWDYTCSDGCCYEYGEDLFVNGEDINADINMSPHDAIIKLLEHLGFEVEWEELDEED